MFSSIKIALIVIMMAGAGGGYIYVKNLKADLATSEANNLKLEESVADQKAVIAQQANDFKSILAANKALDEQNRILSKEFKALDQRFNKITNSLYVGFVFFANCNTCCF